MSAFFKLLAAAATATVAFGLAGCAQPHRCEQVALELRASCYDESRAALAERNRDSGPRDRVTGETAEEIAEEVYELPPDRVETIDPGPVVDSGGVIDGGGTTPPDGSSDDEAAEEITAEGVTQEGTQPDRAEEGEVATDSGNAGVNIF